MPTTFIASSPDPAGTFQRIYAWATENGFQLQGDAGNGTFAGTPGGIAGLVIGRIQGAYWVTGNQVTIRTDKDLPASEVARRLAKFGLTLTSSH